MGLAGWIKGRGASAPRLSLDDEATGLFLFDDVPSAIKAEKVLGSLGYAVKLVAPPPHLRAGCDLAVALPRVEQVGAERALAEADAHAVGWADSADEQCEITDLVTAQRLDHWLMVRSGNMKITVDTRDRRIVNTSGGGCPDIPYLNLQLVGKLVDDVPRPKELGYTLCGLMLDLAFVEAVRMLDEGVTE